MPIDKNSFRTKLLSFKQKKELVDNNTMINSVYYDMGTISDFINSVVSNAPIKKLTYTIGAPGVSGTDYNFISAANTTEQSIQLGATTIIPALSIVTSIMATCSIGCNGAITMSTDIGLTSGSDEWVSAVDLDDTNEIISVGQLVTAGIADSSIYFSGTPSANWSTMTTGTWEIHIYYADGSI